MRITNSTLLRGYNRDLQRIKGEKSNCERKITSSRKFSRASEAPLSAAKALNVRKSQYYSEQYKENLKVASQFYNEAETSLLQVSSKLADIRETIVAAVNTTKDNVDYNIYAQQLETFAHELCTIFNTDTAGRAIFGGESDNSTPFTIINDANGSPATVLYHGVPLNSLDDYMGFPFSGSVFMDIGLGMVMDQLTHTLDPISVLDISFNGAKITGCGAEYGVADVDLSSIQENRNYAIDVYADGVKHTISFRGKGNMKDNVDQINALLQEAFSKEDKAGKNVPFMDDQGMIYLKDTYAAGGKAVDSGIVSVVNNTTLSNNTRIEKLVVENDSNYTNKYKITLGTLAENTVYRMEVEVDGVRKEITFMSGEDDPENEIYREDATIANLQAALDAAFGEGKVNVSDHAPNKGVLSSEGLTVKCWNATTSIGTTTSSSLPTVSEGTCGTLDIDLMVNAGAGTYTLKAIVNGEEKDLTVNVQTGDSGAVTAEDVQKAIIEAFSDAGVENIEFTDNGICMAGGAAVNFTESADNFIVEHPTIKISDMTAGMYNQFTFTINGETKTINIAGGADAAQTAQNVSSALKREFGIDVYVSSDGEIFTLDDSISADDIAVEAGSWPVSDGIPFERERIYSNNYIQLTLDAARALRNGDIEYANGCIDRIVSASEHLLATIADIGCSEDFVDFNIERLTTREENLYERQNDLEITDPEYQITLWKTYEAYYNACLQMSASVVPNSIFNYMK